MSNHQFPVHFHTINELLLLPKPKWLIQDFLHQQETACLWGPPNCGKSFVAIDWALCVSAGVPWLGRYDTLQCPVIYMAGEGAASLQKRVLAWQECYGVDHLDNAYFQVRPLPLCEEDVILTIQEELENYYDGEHDPGLNPGLVVVDTLSQFMGGRDEVGPDMALFVSNLRKLSHEENLSVLIVHHSNAGGARERGHTALRGNVDAMYEAKPRDKYNILEGVTILTDKQRDSAKAEGLAVAFEMFGDSLVPQYDEERNNTEKPPITVSPALRAILQAFDSLESTTTESCSHENLMEALGISKATFHRQLKVLYALGVVKSAGRGKSALTFLGRDVLRLEDTESAEE